MYGLLDIATSGMVAQRQRLDVISSNLANQDAILDAKGEVNPYRRRIPIFQVGSPSGAGTASRRNLGVRMAKIELDTAPPALGAYDPTNPFAYKTGPYKGYVAKSGINSVVENINAMEAMRAYEANVMAADISKQMVASALRLIG